MDASAQTLPPGPLFCVVEGRTAGVDASGATQVREKFADLQAAAGIRKRFRPHQLRHTMMCELILEGKNIVIVQRQLGHANLAVTTNYTNGLPQSQVIDAMRGREHAGAPGVRCRAVTSPAPRGELAVPLASGQDRGL